MPFLAPCKVMLLDDRSVFPWIVLEEMPYEDPLTGDIYVVKKHFRTDGSSVPKKVAALPIVGSIIVSQFFGNGLWLGFKQGVLHDALRRDGTLPPHIAHRVFRTALYEGGYDPFLCESYYQAVRLFNS